MIQGILESFRRDNQPRFPLRIDAKTVVLVTENNYNENHAADLRKKFKNARGNGSVRDLESYY